MKAALTITLPDYAAFLAKIVAARARRKDGPRDRAVEDRREPVEKENGE